MNQEEGLLRFSISELVKVNQAQIKQMISLSLEPHVSVIDNEELVMMKGFLLLQGEYVEEDEQTAKLEQSFPIDVTIPASRVRTIENVQLMIESFDYDFENTNQLMIQADLIVSGIISEDTRMKNQQAPLLPIQEKEEPLTVEPVSTEEDSLLEKVAIGQERSGDVTIEKKQEETRPIVQIDTVKETESNESKQKESVTEQEAQRMERNIEQTEEKEQIEEKQKESITTNHKKEQIERDEQKVEAVEEEREEGVEVEEEAEVHAGEYEQEFLLSDLFDTDEEEQFSQVKIYIVQREETLHTVATRYELPVDELVRFNDLQSYDIEVGMLLYVPIASKKV